MIARSEPGDTSRSQQKPLQRMTILYVCLDPGIAIAPGSGASVHALSMISAMEALGATVDLLASVNLGHSFPSRRDVPWLLPQPRPGLPGRRYVRAANEVLSSAAFRRHIQRAVVEIQPDIIYERYALWRRECGDVAAAAGIPHVLEVNSPLVDESVRFRGLRGAAIARRRERAAWQRPTRVVTVSHGMRERVQHVRSGETVVVANGVDLEVFSPDVVPDVELSRRLQGRFVVAFSGTLKPWHDYEVLIEGVSRLPAALSPVLLVVGDGPRRAHLHQLAAAAGVTLEHTGSVSHAQVAPLLARADVCVVPMSADPQLQYFSPLKAMEYLALGRPTVVTRAGDLIELERAGAALGYEPGDGADLAAALVRLSGEPSLAEGLRLQGMATALGHTWLDAAQRSLDGLVASTH